jgi:hypothetical protein
LEILLCFAKVKVAKAEGTDGLKRCGNFKNCHKPSLSDYYIFNLPGFVHATRGIASMTGGTLILAGLRSVRAGEEQDELKFKGVS